MVLSDRGIARLACKILALHIVIVAISLSGAVPLFINEITHRSGFGNIMLSLLGTVVPFTLYLFIGFVLWRYADFIAVRMVPESQKNGQPFKVDETSFTMENYPKIDGSTVTIPLSQAMASRLLGMDATEAKKFVKHNTTHVAYLNLLEGGMDIIFVTEPSDEELTLAKEKNIELEVIPVVKDAFVFLVNAQNPINTLTVDQIQQIYLGNIQNWKEIGGEDKEIAAYQRPKNSGSQTIMENLVMKGFKIAEAPKEMAPSAMGQLIERVAGYRNSDRALGYSVFYFAKNMYSKDTIKVLAVNGIEPDEEMISGGKYPFTISYYAVLKKSKPADSSARKLLQWLLGRDGQALAESAGYVPLQ